MKTVKKDLERLRGVRKKTYHPLIHKVHKKYKISRKTLFYIKEYGPHTSVPRTIIDESIKILLFASILSSLGGFALEHIKTIFVPIIPLIVLLPALNDMIGDYGTIISSRFSSMLHQGKIRRMWWANQELRKLFIQIFITSIVAAVFSSVIAFVVAYFSKYPLTTTIISKIFLITIIDVISLISIIFLISVFAGLYFYKKGEDPNNLLIPITTSVADFGNMITLSILVILFF